MPCLLPDDGYYNWNMMTRYLRLVLVVLFCLTTVACGREPSATDGDERTGIAAFAPAQRPRSGVQAEIALFSGRPNPQWGLSEQESETLWAMLAALDPVATGEPPGDLGYQGFRIRYVQPGARASSEIAIFDGIVYYTVGQQALSAADPDRWVERWLATLARQHLDFPMYMALPEEIRSAPGKS